MNVYDAAHELANSIKSSGEFKEYTELKKQVEQSPELSSMIQDYQAKQFEIQAKQVMGEEVAPDVMDAFRGILNIMAQDPLAARYLQSEARFTIMMNDVYQILGEVMGLAKFDA